MRCLVMVRATAESEAGVLPSERLLGEMMAFNQELVKAGVMLAGEGLRPSSQGKRVYFAGSGRNVVDGPFAETKEQLLGFYVVDCAHMDEAMGVAQDLERANPGVGAYEVRPVRLFLPGVGVEG